MTTEITAPATDLPAGTEPTLEEKIHETHAAIKNIEHLLVHELAPKVDPVLASLEPLIGKLNGPMGSILGSMLGGPKK